MTLDEAPMSTKDYVRAAEADAARTAYFDYLAEREIESVEARESYWRGVMRAMPAHIRDTRYERDAG